MNSSSFTTLRSVLELLYFLSGIAIAIIAGYGLTQLRLTKRIATKNAKRESVKFAAERCQYYAERVVVIQSAAWQSYHVRKLACFVGQTFAVKDGEIVQHNFESQKAAQCRQELGTDWSKFVELANSFEAFAIPFVAGVADDELGYQETAAAFCLGVSQLMLFIFILRAQGARFESCVRLYESWFARMEVEKMKPVVKSYREKMKAAEKSKVPPMDVF
jgi:hypothetical protein